MLSKSKRYKSSQGTPPQARQQSKTPAATPSPAAPPAVPSPPVQRVNPDKLSLDAHKHLQAYLGDNSTLSKDDVTAVLRLSQHLRVFGLLSAVGYLNQAKDGKVAERTVPVWHALLRQCVGYTSDDRRALQEWIVNIARNAPENYLILWRRALALSSYWNFWARAYQEQQP